MLHMTTPHHSDGHHRRVSSKCGQLLTVCEFCFIGNVSHTGKLALLVVSCAFGSVKVHVPFLDTGHI